jgi:hypothetical protein
MRGCEYFELGMHVGGSLCFLLYEFHWDLGKGFHLKLTLKYMCFIEW